ncbi:MAG TPA: MBL fold metallo-hydrolase [Actinomycetota bacterium]|nr:MBL fold metallo-hydrolase [Actinomycetota bacterium]
MTGPETIDLNMHGFPGITGAFLVRGEKTALVETGPKSSLEHLLAGLRANGVERVDYVVVTHIHLDHAGAAGTLARRWPDATVVVHPVGAPHLADPSKLWSSAGRIYGDAMERLWGGIDPVPPGQLREIGDGERVDLGGTSLRAIETPGHARHHHAFLEESSGTLFCGDALGVRLPDVGVIRPATPPPEFDLEAAIASIGRVKELRPDRLCFTHFGAKGDEDPAGVCDAAVDALVEWAGWVRAARDETDSVDGAADYVRRAASAAYAEHLDDASVARLEQTTSYRMNTWGYMRYMDKLGS